MKRTINKMARLVCTALVVCLLGAGSACGQAADNDIPRLEQKNGRWALYVDGSPYFMLGGQSGNSSTWPAALPGVWTAINGMSANTLEIPIYWEQVEPEPGKYDFSMLQMLLDQARQNKKRLVILWFATWKNGSNHYMPEWMKKDSKKYPNVMTKDGKFYDSPSPHAKAAMELDAKAFVEVMKYLKKADPQHTVIMVQVQNEPGSWGSVRDYSPAANKLFDAPVPEALLKPETLKELGVPAGSKGTWAQLFGDRADEYFHAWHVASYIEYVAAAGKAVYPLPMYANAALRNPLTNPPATDYESGGPTDNVIPIWKAAAPSIDILAPDIYLTGHETVFKLLELYGRPDNALFVPETSSGNNALYVYEVIKNGIGFSPFGVDRRGGGATLADYAEMPLSKDYKLLAPMARELAQWGFEGKIYSAVEPENNADVKIDLGGDWEGVLSFGAARRGTPAPADAPARRPTGKAMFVKLGENEFLVTATNCRISFLPKGKNAGRDWQYLKVKEGYWDNGFKMNRVLNGDQTDWTGPYVGAEPSLLLFTLTTR